MKKKRGQATIFIILGLVIVIFIALIFYIKSDLVREKIEQLGFKGIVVPERVQTIVFYVDGCLSSIAKEGLDIMGRQGGYVRLPSNLEYQYGRSLQIDDFTKNPYWLSQYGQEIPTNELMERQLEDYIEKNFEKKCNLESFRAIGYGFRMDDLDVGVTINKENVVIKLNSEFDTKIGEDIFVLKQYINGKVDVSFGKIIDLGKKIVEKEANDGSLEYNTLNLISNYERDENLPPMAGMDFTCNPKVWLKRLVKIKLKEILAVNIPYLKIEGTDFEQRKSEFYDTMIWDVNARGYEDLIVNFAYYKDWDLFLDVNPSDGESIRIEPWRAGISLLPFFCVTYYNFRYDLRYPVLVSIYDGDYSFSFPIEVDLRDNYYRERLSTDTSLEEVRVRSLFCDPGQRLSQDVDVYVIDAYTGNELDGVSVIYECGAGDECYIGETVNGILREKFPLCYNGIINIAKEGYLGYKERFTTSDTSQEELPGIALEPFRTKKIKGQVLENGVVRDLKKGEELVIYIEKKSSTYEGFEYSIGVDLNSDNNEEEIELVPGEYSVEMTLIDNNEIKIPAETFKTKGFLFFGGKEVTIPEQTVSGLVVGGGNFVWNLAKERLDNNDKVTIIATHQGIPRKYSELDENFNNLDKIVVEVPVWE